MAPRYLLSPQAQEDLRTIGAYYLAEAGARVARDVLLEFTRAFRLLATSPDVGHRREDLTSEPVRFWPVFSYLIVYTSTSQPIGVVRILHGSRNLDALFQRYPPRMT
ncbi:type II toxin-antitoxin system RelE/ParE family toxin [Tistrella mobilis]|uniref:type II toxin-antitoxin system RelE/ParE family toxin n=1 Tax=Tistrella mobilis TaxID=171437 RepID=UPI0035587BA6